MTNCYLRLDTSNKRDLLFFINYYWPQIVGPGIADHTKVIDVSKGTLTIDADSRVWAVQLKYLGTPLRTAINKKLALPDAIGTVKAIDFFYEDRRHHLALN